MATTKAAQPPKALPVHSSAAMADSGCPSNPPTGTAAPKNQFSVNKFFKMMKYERLRLITYLLYGHQWPLMDAISPSELAKAGFFYLHDDAVQCTFCRGIIRQWSPGDDPMEEHARHFPKCPFVLGEYCGNMPFEIDPDINSDKTHFKPAEKAAILSADSVPPNMAYNKSDIPRFPLFSSPSNRSRTFLSPNWKCSVDRQQLIDAGFFYTGKEDRTRCFHCGGLLFKWAPNENPLEEHARFFPECHFMLETSGQSYIEFVQFKTQIIELRKKMDSPQSVKDADIACMEKISHENFLKMKQSAYRMMNKLERRNSGASDKSADGSTSLSKYLNKFSFLTDCQKLFQYLTSLEIMQPTSPTAPESPNTSVASTSSSSASSASPKSINLSIFSLDDNSEADDKSTKSSSDEEEDSQRRSRPVSLECVICRDKQIEIVFVPCGHQIACRRCADKVNQCPICKGHIDNKVRTYFAH